MEAKKNLVIFLSIAFASGAELETQLEVARMLGFADKQKIDEVRELLTEVMKMLNKMISSLRA